MFYGYGFTINVSSLLLRVMAMWYFESVIIKIYATGIMNSHSDVRLFYVNGPILLSRKISYL